MVSSIRNSPAPPRVSSARRSTGTGGASFAQAPSSNAAAAPSRGVVPTLSVTSMDAVMALQGVDDPAGRRARAMRRGSRMLDDLEDLKVGLLEGRISESRLGSLVQCIASSRERTDDEGLETLLDGIDLRARVELAKLGR